MRPIPKPLLKKMLDDPYYDYCCHEGCGKQAEKEHAIIIGGRQLNTYWSIIPCCPDHNRGPKMDKRRNEWVALNRATDEELNEYPKANLIQKRNHLNTIYGTYTGRT